MFYSINLHGNGAIKNISLFGFVQLVHTHTHTLSLSLSLSLSFSLSLSLSLSNFVVPIRAAEVLFILKKKKNKSIHNSTITIL